METLPPFRVLTRLQAVALLAAITVVGAFVLWLGLEGVDVYLERLEALRQTNPEAAIAATIIHLKILAVIQILPLTALSAFMIWYSRRVIATQSMPPAGAWIIEGQRVRTGAAATRNARLLLTLTGGLVLVGCAEIAYLYFIATSLQQRTGVF